MKLTLLRPVLLGLLLLAAVSCNQERNERFQHGLEAQLQAERLLAAGDTTAALHLFREAYIAFVDSDHPERWSEVQAGIQQCEHTQEDLRITRKGLRDLLDTTRATASGLRAREERVWGRVYLIGGISILVCAFLVALYFIHRRRSRQDLQLILAELHDNRQQLSSLRVRSSSPALSLALHHYDQLCSRYEPKGDNTALLREFQQQIADMQHNKAFDLELDASLAESDPTLPGLIRTLPDTTDEDRRLLRYLMAGLPTHLVGAAMGKTRSAINMQTSRLRTRIEAKDPALAVQLFALLDARRPGRPQKQG